ncbi:MULTISPECIES: PhnA domain-containing protein [Nitrosomonas]|uniref:Phosphonoacetate hydrolase n=1 Tax=Nitrosomonas communis TaxID=44574 RepID=A0A5D3Y761_9PROT|nr:phosphonoacetate hydrolase [Nitrosomonas communis]
MKTKDNNESILQDVDALVVIKDLKVKGFPDEIKRGTGARTSA